MFGAYDGDWGVCMFIVMIVLIYYNVGIWGEIICNDMGKPWEGVHVVLPCMGKPERLEVTRTVACEL